MLIKKIKNEIIFVNQYPTHFSIRVVGGEAPLISSLNPKLVDSGGIFMREYIIYYYCSEFEINEREYCV